MWSLHGWYWLTILAAIVLVLRFKVRYPVFQFRGNILRVSLFTAVVPSTLHPHVYLHWPVCLDWSLLCLLWTLYHTPVITLASVSHICIYIGHLVLHFLCPEHLACPRHNQGPSSHYMTLSSLNSLSHDRSPSLFVLVLISQVHVSFQGQVYCWVLAVTSPWDSRFLAYSHCLQPLALSSLATLYSVYLGVILGHSVQVYVSIPIYYAQCPGAFTVRRNCQRINSL